MERIEKDGNSRGCEPLNIVWLLRPGPWSSTKVYSGRGSQHCYEIKYLGGDPADYLHLERRPPVGVAVCSPFLSERSYIGELNFNAFLAFLVST
jgi:hypothetical protein